MSRLLAVLLLVALGAGQPYKLKEWVIDEGGRKTTSGGGRYVARGSIHQTTIGRTSAPGANLSAWIGYWHPWPQVPRHDVGTVQINKPARVSDTMLAITPSADVFNHGNCPETFLVRFIITHANGDPFYRDSAQVMLQPVTGKTQLFRQVKFHELGHYVVTCSTALNPDTVPGNDRVVQMTKVVCRPPWPTGWYEVASVPSLPSSKQVRRGGWVTFMPSSCRFFVAKGNKTGDFHSYCPIGDTWSTRPSFPGGTSGKLPSNGAAATTDGGRFIYAVKGNNTCEFWNYDAVADSWHRLLDVPLGITRKKIKGGSDLAYVEKNGTGYVYLLKGTKNEVWRYDVVAERWDPMPMAPSGINIKWDKGSWLCYDGERYLYAHKAKYSELWTFDAVADTWWHDQRAGIPVFNHRTMRNRKAKDGSSGAWYDGAIHALKGGNTNEFWRYSVQDNEWIELDTIPTVGSTLKPVRVKDGGDICAFGDGIFYATKGNRSYEFWRYVIDAEIVRPPEPRREGVAGAEQAPGGPWFSAGPSPVVSGFAAVSFSLARAGTARVTVFDVSGRAVMTRTFAPARIGGGSLDLRGFGAGIYVVKLESAGFTATQKLVVQR